MNKNFPKWILFLAIPCVLVAAGYFALMQYYKENIPYGTWINGIYCTGMTYDDVAKKLLETSDYEVRIEVVDKEGNVYNITPDASTYTLSYRENLEEQVASFGARGLFSEKEITHNPTITILENAWNDFIETHSPLFDVEEPKAGARVFIEETGDGFKLIDLCLQVLDKEKAKQVIADAIEAGESYISLVDYACYFDLPYTEEEKGILLTYDALQTFCGRITFDLTIQGEKFYTIDASVIKDWVLKDQNGEFVLGKGGIFLLDEAKVKEYAQSVSEEVTTYWGKPWQFVDHSGENIEVEAGNYGRKLKTNNLAAKLINAFNTGTSGVYELEFTFYPESAKEVEYGGGYGDSYVEVDIAEQHVYVYIDGELVLDSPCVTGDVRRNRLTPTGVFYIEYKQRNRTLRGEDYATPVSYWMHFYNHCGFHDANWRRKFGEDIYLNDGSHGCVNMPPAKAKEMYGLVYKGMPVIVY